MDETPTSACRTSWRPNHRSSHAQRGDPRARCHRATRGARSRPCRATRLAGGRCPLHRGNRPHAPGRATRETSPRIRTEPGPSATRTSPSCGAARRGLRSQPEAVEAVALVPSRHRKPCDFQRAHRNQQRGGTLQGHRLHLERRRPDRSVGRNDFILRGVHRRLPVRLAHGGLSGRPHHHRPQLPDRRRHQLPYPKPRGSLRVRCRRHRHHQRLALVQLGAQLDSNTYVGKSVAGERYNATLGGYVFVNGASTTYLPGSAGRVTATGGQYA